jgi:predicted PilT family ATPase
VKTSAFLFGFSKIGLAEFGPPRRVDEIRGDAFKDDLDALLADTARRDSAVLVTADKRLSRKAKAVGVEVWHPTDLIDLIWSLELEESAKPESSPYMHN